VDDQLPIPNLKERVITLTNEAPIRIVEREWPVLAFALWSDNPEEPRLAQTKGRVFVRRHEDGRAIVYGTKSRRGDHVAAGYRLDPGVELVDSIRTVALELGLPVLAARCIAKLPAQVLE
jgi:hypothetical protein